MNFGLPYRTVCPGFENSSLKIESFFTPVLYKKTALIVRLFKRLTSKEIFYEINVQTFGKSGH